MGYSRDGLYGQAPRGSGGGVGGVGGVGGGVASFLGGLFGDSGSAYNDAMDEYNKWMQKGEGALNPFVQAGQGAIPDYQKWLQGMQDPSKFINNLTSQYQESPWAKFQQQQGIRTANNLGSASGLTGSTPLQMQAQQNAQNISSQDMNQWLQNVLGINTQYGRGNEYLMGQGANAANSLAGMYGNAADAMGQFAYDRKAAQNNDWMNTMGGAFNLASNFTPFKGAFNFASNFFK